MVVVYLKMVFRKRKPITLVARDSYEQRVKWKLIVTLIKSFLFVFFLTTSILRYQRVYYFTEQIYVIYIEIYTPGML